jgi:hypothetical protein
MPPSFDSVFMIAPASFGFNAETAATNRFQQRAHSTSTAATNAAAAAAKDEAAGLALALRSAGVDLCVVSDREQPPKPDAVFPNNWVSFHEDGTLVLYPMHSANRRLERSEAVIDQVKQGLGFIESRRIDLTGEEKHGRFLEGTGSLVLDGVARVAYACRSARTDESLVREWARLMDFEAVLFDATTPDGTPVYHTNVLLWIGQRIAGIGLDWIAPADRAQVKARLAGNDSARDLLLLDSTAIRGFAGNMLEIRVRNGELKLAMSATAAACLSQLQRAQLQAAGCRLVVAAIPTIEKLGGGSVRCMLAQVPSA